MTLNLDEIETVARAAEPGPWSACGEARGGCACGAVLHKDGLVCEVTSGDWGNEYPALRIIGGSLEQKAEPYIDMMVLGHVPHEKAAANARHIATLDPTTTLALVEEIRSLRRMLGEADALIHQIWSAPDGSLSPDHEDAFDEALYRHRAREGK